MTLSEELRTVVENVLGSPKLTVAVAGVTGGYSFHTLSEAFQSALSTAGIIAGIAATILLSRKHWIDYKNGLITNKLLTAQLNAMGAEPITEKLP
jgi:hypothetical protein